EAAVTRYLIERFVQTVITLFFIALITFALMHSVPGGPFDVQGGERGVSQEFIRRQEAYYGLDRPLPAQFVNFLGNLLRGDLGISFAQRGQPVTDRLLDKVRPSLLLGAMSFGIVLGIGIPLGIISAIRRNTIWDYGALALSTVLAAVPSFVLAFFLLIFFAIWLGWFDVRMG